MPAAPIPTNETSRLEALRALRVLDTAPEQSFDELTELARETLGMPIALVSLVDEHRQWFKSSPGLDACETPRSLSVCAYVVLNDELLVIEDLSADDRTSDNPLVTGGPEFRFYAGAPITLSSGETVGSFCVLDYEPRSMTPAQAGWLSRMASVCAAMLETRRSAIKLEETDRRLQAIQNAAPVGLLYLEPLRDTRTRIVDFRICDANSTANRMLRRREGTLSGTTVLECLPALREHGDDDVMRSLLHTVASGDPGSVVCDYHDRQFSLSIRWNIARADGRLVVSIEDIGESRAHQREIEARDALLKQFVKYSPAAVAMMDTELRCLVASDGWRSAYGLGDAELGGRSHYEIFPEISDEWKELHRRALAGEELSCDRDRFERADGSVQYLRWQVQPWRDAAGTIGGVIMLTEDVSERVARETEIERSRDLLEQTQTMSEVGGWAVDITTSELHWTEQTYRIHGLPVNSKSPCVAEAIRFYVPEHREMVTEAVDAAMSSGEPFDYEAEIIRADGERVPVRSIGQPVVEGDEVVRIVGAFQDLTKIRAAQEERDRDLVMLKTLSEGTADLIFVKDLEGRFLFVNPAMAQFCGRSEAEIIGRADTEILPPDVAETCREGDRCTIEGNQVVVFDEAIPCGGETRHYKTTKQPYRLSDGRIVGVIALCHDVTEIKRQEEERRRLIGLITAITDASSDVIFVKDVEGRVIFGNPAYAAAMGKSIDNLIGTSEYEFFDDPKTAERLRATDREVMESGEPKRIEERMNLPATGEHRIFSTEKHPYRLSDGTIGGVIGVGRDITDLRAAVEEARISGMRLNLALSAANVGYWDHDLVHNTVYYADSWYTMLGYEPGELPMTPECFWETLIHPDDIETARRAQDACLNGETDRSDPFIRLRNKAGSWQWIRDVGGVIEHDAEGNPTRIVGVQVDVDESKQAQDRLEMALLAANEGLWEWSIPDNTCYFDDQWYRILGFEPGELPMTFETWERLCHPDDLDVAREQLRDYLVGRAEEYAVEHRLRTKDGQWKWVLGTGRITERDEHGKPTRVVGVNLGIDERRHAAEQLERAVAEAESANLAKSQFLANMSHEIRTPMTAILGYAELMAQDEAMATDPEHLRQTAGVIQRNGEHLLAIINDILDISKIDAGRMTVEAVPTDLRELFNDVNELLRERATQKGLRFDYQQRGPLPRTVMTDPVRIRQILMNLIQNAIKFTEQGTITVRVESERRPAHMVVSIIDTGMGISEEKMGTLFTAFQQGDDSMARRFGGTGLGLAISMRLAVLLGGELSASSRVGRGSTFRLLLPLDVEHGTEWIEPDLSPSAKPTDWPGTPYLLASGIEGMRILLVEDGPDNQRLISHHLRKAGAVVIIASNGAEGVRAVEQASRQGEPFDLVLMDMQMPVMDGYTATARLREQGATLPIVALTAHAMSGDRERCLAAGCDEFETKPISRERLIKRCAAVRAQRRDAA